MRLPGPALVPAFLLLVGCQGVPGTYAPPPQREALLKRPVGLFIDMKDPDAAEYILDDTIQDMAEGDGWRWTHEQPRLRFFCDRERPLKFTMDFRLPEDNFKATGPVTISYWIDRKLLAKVRYQTPGRKRFEAPVPPGWILANAPVLFRADVDPPWIAPEDGAKLGVVLFSAGFIE